MTLFVYEKEEGKRKCQITEVVKLKGVRLARSYCNFIRRDILFSCLIMSEKAT